jgi:NADPH2:quinone reductase
MPKVPLLSLMQRRGEIHGTVLRPRSIDEKAAATRAFTAEVVPMLADGRIAPVVERVFPLADAAAAYALVQSDVTFGKVVLDPG